MSRSLVGLIGSTCRDLSSGKDHTVIGWELSEDGRTDGVWCTDALGIVAWHDLTPNLEFRNVRTNPDEALRAMGHKVQ